VADPFLKHYLAEQESLQPAEIERILDRGRQWPLATLLSAGGSAIFPHTYLRECGDQVAAVVHGCLDSGSDQVVVLGVLHSLCPELAAARQREARGEPVREERSHGIWGPGAGGDRYWKEEFSLLGFHFLWNEEVKRRGGRAPRLVVRYPSLVAAAPDQMRRVDELASLAKDSVVVATGDLCHHGAAYGDGDLLDIGAKAEGYARSSIEHALSLLQCGDYRGYDKQCKEHRSDAVDTGALVRHLLGPLRSTVVDLRLVDVSELFEGKPEPSWVAAALVAMERV